jgi:hypothetical protein
MIDSGVTQDTREIPEWTTKVHRRRTWTKGYLLTLMLSAVPKHDVTCKLRVGDSYHRQFHGGI